MRVFYTECIFPGGETNAGEHNTQGMVRVNVPADPETRVRRPWPDVNKKPEHLTMWLKDGGAEELAEGEIHTVELYGVQFLSSYEMEHIEKVAEEEGWTLRKYDEPLTTD